MPLHENVDGDRDLGLAVGADEVEDLLSGVEVCHGYGRLRGGGSGLVLRLKMLMCMRAAARVLDILPKPSKGGGVDDRVARGVTGDQSTSQ